MNQVLQLFPEALDVNGDAQNALVLVQRATWAGIPTALVSVDLAHPSVEVVPAAVVIGSSVDSALGAVRAGLESLAPKLRDWAAAGVPILAVGTGMELLGEDGIGLLPGRPVPRGERATGDLVVQAAIGRLVGFENHARGYELPPGAQPLGSIVRGVGNDERIEGVRAGSVWGTHLHGPVLAKNPAFADILLSSAFGERYSPEHDRIRFVDGLAAAARRAITDRLGVDPAG